MVLWRRGVVLVGAMRELQRCLAVQIAIDQVERSKRDGSREREGVEPPRPKSGPPRRTSS